MTPQTKLRVLIAVAACCLIGGALMWSFAERGGRMKSFCELLAPGTSVAAIRARATERGYRFIPPTSDGRQPGLVIDGQAMGRFLCEVRLSDDRLVLARYRLND